MNNQSVWDNVNPIYISRSSKSFQKLCDSLDREGLGKGISVQMDTITQRKEEILHFSLQTDSSFEQYSVNLFTFNGRRRIVNSLDFSNLYLKALNRKNALKLPGQYPKVVRSAKEVQTFFLTEQNYIKTNLQKIGVPAKYAYLLFGYQAFVAYFRAESSLRDERYVGLRLDELKKHAYLFREDISPEHFIYFLGNRFTEIQVEMYKDLPVHWITELHSTSSAGQKER